MVSNPIDPSAGRVGFSHQSADGGGSMVGAAQESGFAGLPAHLQLSILARLPSSEGKRALARVSRGWRELLLSADAWPHVEAHPVNLRAAQWLLKHNMVRSVVLKPVSEPEAVLANDIYLSYASGMERLFLDLSAIEHHVHSFSYLWFALQNLRLRELAVSGREVDLAVLPDSLQRLAIRADVVRSPHALARLSRLVSLDLVVGQDEKQSKVAAVRHSLGSLNSLMQLEELALNTQAFSDEVFSCLAQLSRLRIVKLDCTCDFFGPLRLPPACSLQVYARGSCHPAISGFSNLTALELKDVAGGDFDASVLAPCRRLAALDISFNAERAHLRGLERLTALRSLKTGGPALRLSLPPLPLTHLEAVAFHELDLSTTHTACDALCFTLRSVYFHALDFGIGVSVFVFAAGRRGLDLHFANDPLRILTPDQLHEVDDGEGTLLLVPT